MSWLPRGVTPTYRRDADTVSDTHVSLTDRRRQEHPCIASMQIRPETLAHAHSFSSLFLLVSSLSPSPPPSLLLFLSIALLLAQCTLLLSLPRAHPMDSFMAPSNFSFKIRAKNERCDKRALKRSKGGNDHKKKNNSVHMRMYMYMRMWMLVSM